MGRRRGVSARRRRRIRELTARRSPGRGGEEVQPPDRPARVEYWRLDGRGDEPPYIRPPRGDSTLRWRRVLVQCLLAFFLVVGVYLAQGSHSPLGREVRGWLTRALTEEFDFSQVALWYENSFGSSPSFLPAFTVNPSPGMAVQLPVRSGELVPVRGEVVHPFSDRHQGIRLSLASETEVPAVMEGWVVFAGEREGMGRTVILKHGGGLETWYALLGEIAVSPEDWVQAGETIGRVEKGAGEGHYFFALRQNGQFVNPEVVLDGN